MTALDHRAHARDVIGRAASLAMALWTLVFAVSLVWELLALSAPPRILGYVASLLLAVSVVIAMACLYEGTREPLRIYGVLALAASLLYAPFCMGTYFLQLAAVELNPANLSTDVLRAIRFEPGSPTFALDMLGYGFLCLSTLAAGFALDEARDRALRVACFFHGALAIPTFASPFISGAFQSEGGEADFTGHYVLLFWCVVFVPIALLLARHFGDERPAVEKAR